MITKGQKINDRYEVIRSIGEGGMANVYLGYDTILDRNVAIKVLRGDLSNDEKFVRRFQREALSASSLAHPNIVEMYDVGEDDGIYYIVMEYIDGITLKQLLKKRGSLTLSEAIDIMSQLTDGMAHAHDSYIIHRDLKPQNIMIKDDGSIKITDFGIAMALNSTQLTQTNSVMGSVHYLPPEQASGKGATVKSDIYSMGIIFYELLTGKLPFKGDNAVEIALKQMRDPLPSVRDENSEIPQSVENIIIKATAKNPKNRYEDSRGMHEDLLTCLNDDRMDEDPIKLKYPEHEASETKRIKKLEELPKEKENVDALGDTKDISTKVEDLEDSRSRKLIIILSSILAVAILAIIFVFVIFPNISTTKNIEIPSCVGDKVSVCQEKLKKAGFTVNSNVKETYSEEVEENRIVKTSPAEGRVVKKGAKITMYKSLGPETYKLEDYTGKVCVEVKANLESKYGLTVTCEKKEVSEAVEDSTLVIGQTPDPETELKKGDSLTLYIPNQVETFPDIMKEKWSMDDIEAFCKKYGINLKVVKQPTDASVASPGTILDVSRRPGTSIVKGSTLTVTIAEKPKETPQAPDCSTYTDETACTSASCKWDTVTNACS